MIRPGRLRRTLAINSTESLFELFIEDAGTYTADQFGEVSISHGSSGPEGGVTVPTMSATVADSFPARAQRQVRLRLSDALATRITAGTPYTAANIRDRFRGRMAADTIHDYGDGNRRTTDIQCTSWIALLRNSARTVPFYANGLILASLRTLIAHPSLSNSGRLSVLYPDTAHSDRTFEAESLTFSDAISKYCADLGILAQVRRDGDVSLLPITKRREILQERIASQWPILRSEALTPATWTQPIETPSVRYELLHLTDQDTVFRWEWPLPPGADTGVLVETEEVDWSNIRTITENYRAYMDALNHRTNTIRHTLNSITIDLLMLLKSSRAYDRRIAAQLLVLHEGDPIYLSGDWPTAIRGPYLVTGIKEQITSQQWTLELDLGHPRNVLGLADNEIPAVPPKVWDSAYTAWNETAVPWDNF